MLPCLRPSLSTAATNSPASPPFSQGSVDETPISSVQPSPTVNLTREYSLAVHTKSFSEIWSKIHHDSHSDEKVETGQVELFEESKLLEQVLHPSRECVLEALSHTRASTLTKLVAKYFNHSESTTRLCLLIHRSIHRARLIYAPLGDLLDILPVYLENDAHFLTQIQCDRAFDIFLQFDQFDNPFPSPSSYNFDDMRCCFSQLREELDHRLHKSRSKVHLLSHATRGSVICLVAATVGVIIAAVAIATHAFVALVASPSYPVCLPSKVRKKELSHLAQLDAAARGTFVLHGHLDTIDRLVTQLRIAFEDNKFHIRFGLERGKDRHPIQQVVKQLRKTHSNIMQQLTDFDEHLCLCFAAINRARSLLLGEIDLY